MENNNIFEISLAYRKSGLDIIPDHPIEKYPVGFSSWEKKTFTEEELKDCIINKGWGIGVRNQEGLDFDNDGKPTAKEVIEKWRLLVNAISPGLVDRLLIEETQHKGYHVAWRCEVIEGNQKLASRLPTEEELQNDPKIKSITFIETRGLGGQFVVSPTPGYKLLQGDWCNLPQITPEERSVLLQCARSLDLMPATTEDFEVPGNDLGGDRPGDIFNQRGIDESLELLKQEGWTVVYEQENSIYLRRPGKDRGVSATLGYIAPGIFYNFSSNGDPFEPNKAYTPFAIFTLLKHGGNFSLAASELAKRYNISLDSHNSLNSHSQVEWPEPVDEAAYYGITGEVVRTIEPHTEADNAALIINFLTAFGSVIGSRAYIAAEGDKHPARLFDNLVGQTSKGRKGTSWGHIKKLFTAVDQNWANNIASGLSSGEGLLYAVRDEVVKTKTDKSGNTTEVIEDQGVTDKRLLVVESEFSSALKVIKREGNTLSPIIRSAWDSGDLRTLTKNSPIKATGAHISIIGHITKDELLRHLDDTEYANGFGNRFLWICTKRSKILPFGGKISDEEFLTLVSKLKRIVNYAQSVDEICWSEEAKLFWKKIYEELSEGRPGLIGALLGRAEPYVIRLSSIYALLDISRIIKPVHLKAALAIWQYNEESVEYIFQSKTGDNLTNKIYDLLLGNQNGLTKTQINDKFGNHLSSVDLVNSLENLSRSNLVYSKGKPSGGREAELWFVIPGSELRNKRSKRILDSYKKYDEELNLHSPEPITKLEVKIPDPPEFPANLKSLPLDRLQDYNKNFSDWLTTCPPLFTPTAEFDQVMNQQRQIGQEISKREEANIPF